MNDTLRNLGKDELVELLEIYAKNLIALDGKWRARKYGVAILFAK